MAVAATLALYAAPALAVPAANLYVVPSGGSSTGVYPSGCTQAAPCTLARAIEQSNSNAALDGYAVVINLASGTYTAGNTIQASGDSPYSVALLGASSINPGVSSNPGATVLNGGGSTRTLYVNGVNYTVTISDLTLANGSTGGDGANLLAAASSGTVVQLQDDVVTGGTSTPGGQADVASGYLDVNNTTIEDSGSDTYGSLATGSGVLTVDDSTYTGNRASAIYTASSGRASITASTIAGNTSGVSNASSQTTTVSDSTISGNTASGLSVAAGGIAVSRSILASNAGSDCATAVTDGGNNVLDDGSCGFGTTLGSRQFTTAQIGLIPLANNGGYTETERITASSVAHDFLPTVSLCEGNDQRGIVQLQPGQTDCDAGAYQYAPPTLSAISPASAEPGSATEIALSGQNLAYATASFGSASAPATVENSNMTLLYLGVPSVALLPLGSEPITVTNADGSTTIGFTAVGPTIGTLAGTAAYVGQAYSYTIPVSGSVRYPVTLTVSSGTLPAGLTLSSSGSISGTPTAAGAFNFTIKLVDALGVTVTQPESLTVVAPTVTLASPKVALKPGGAWVRLGCGAAQCSGYGKLTATVRVKITKGGKTQTKREKIVLALGRYLVKANASNGLGILSFTPAGVRERTLLRQSKGSLRATVSLTLSGGADVTAPVTLTAPKPPK